ncbi:hypothetical protein HNO88_001899 [Novosphingobium chloroacetimidivorans]|uniref:Uncharacterized protein n=1 Tax=Novosphingobium chloroacetimidivorans TaxID=1428314 RepID=A0A7W7NVR5_9SPHN|nr:hypothetical protein [Novosphingobium chloroacetimidivorans]MBB4858576.1 hypothetical protein [Novosphingobium chloroacetimidivorans]
MKPLDTGDFVPALDLAEAYAPEIESGDYVIDSFGQLKFATAASAPSGAALRRRLITPEVLARMDAEQPRKTLLQRLLRR